MEETFTMKQYILRTMVPLVLGSILALSGTLIAGHLSRADKQLSELRAAYVQYFTDVDTINDDIVKYYDDIHSVLDAHFSASGKFTDGTLTEDELELLKDCHKRSEELKRRIRKTSFTVLLIEPDGKWRNGIRDFMNQTVTYLEECDRIGYLLPRRFKYSTELARELEERGTLIKRLGDLDGEYQNQLDSFHDFVDTALESSRWQG